MLGIDLLPLYRQEKAEYALTDDPSNFPSFKEWKLQYECEYEVRDRLDQDISADDVMVEVSFSCDFDAVLESEGSIENPELQVSAL